MTTDVLEQQQTYSAEDYLAMEEAALEKHEYRNGKIITMPGGTATHNIIAVNITTALKIALKETSCRVFNADMRLWIADANRFTYPDAMVVCGALEFGLGRQDLITNPTLIVEVLSESTKSDDRGEKFDDYRTLKSFQEYVLVHQKEKRVEKYHKLEAERWMLEIYTDPKREMALRSLNASLILNDCYDGVELEEKAM